MFSAAVPWRRRIYLVGLGDLSDDLPGGRVDGGEPLPADGVVPFIIDEELEEKKKKTRTQPCTPGLRGEGGVGGLQGKRSESR